MTESLEEKTALVTGGSSGLGVGIARELAERGADVVIVARREERLRAVAEQIADDFDVHSDWVSMDLADPEAPPRLYDEMQERDYEIDILVNNAGFGLYGEDLEFDWESEQTMLRLNMLTPVHLTKLFGRDMAERGWGRMIQLASIGSFQPSPTYGAYSATKAFLLSWGESIDFELKGTGVSSTVVCPGPTRTEFFDEVDQEQTWYQKITMMDRDDVCSIAVRAMLRQRMTVVPGFLNALSVWLVRFLPRRFVRWFAFQTMRNE